MSYRCWALAAKVLAVHGDRHPELAEVRALVDAIRDDIEPHLQEEETVLFPAVHAYLGGGRPFPSGAIADLVHSMRTEHDRLGRLLAELRRATGAFAVPPDACASYRSLYGRLETLELDTHVHVHKENHALFPALMTGPVSEGSEGRGNAAQARR